jgi:hypothetical protein
MIAYNVEVILVSGKYTIVIEMDTIFTLLRFIG